MKIVVDDKIPFIREAIDDMADEAVYMRGSAISPDDIRDADALVIRTRTRCTEQLLGGSRVSFIATATVGYDHMDIDYLNRAGIEWMSCPGCNAGSVAQYVQSALILLKRKKNRVLNGMTMGIVGCGHIGSRVQKAAEAAGMKVLLCDPPRQAAGDGGTFVSIDDIKELCDVITFHVPLTRKGANATYHLADESFFGGLKRRPVIINTSRGGVVEDQALKRAIIYNKVSETIIDTWEHEPLIDRELLEMVWIGTPHIAGYSADGKANADNMVIEGLCRHFNITNRWHVEPPALPANFTPTIDEDTLRLRLYNPINDCRKLRRSPGYFEEMRGNYRLRREIYTL